MDIFWIEREISMLAYKSIISYERHHLLLLSLQPTKNVIKGITVIIIMEIFMLP